MTNNLQANKSYEKHIRQIRDEDEAVRGQVCKNADHKHIMATTYSCLENK